MTSRGRTTGKQFKTTCSRWWKSICLSLFSHNPLWRRLRRWQKMWLKWPQYILMRRITFLPLEIQEDDLMNDDEIQ